MKIRKLMICLSLMSLIFLQGCKEESSNEFKGYQSDLKAKADDLYGYYLTSGMYQLYFEKDHMTIMGKISGSNPETGKSYRYVLDEILEDQGKNSVFEEYDDVKIKTKGNLYTISFDDYSIQFLKFKEHILVDKYGKEYIRDKLPEQ